METSYILTKKQLFSLFEELKQNCRTTCVDMEAAQHHITYTELPTLPDPTIVDYKERLNYTETKDGLFIGNLPNFNLPNFKGVVCQAKTLKDLISKTQILFKVYIEFMHDVANQQAPFEIVKVDKL
jgi:predicted RNase H-like HicB family nuclease